MLYKCYNIQVLDTFKGPTTVTQLKSQQSGGGACGIFIPSPELGMFILSGPMDPHSPESIVHPTRCNHVLERVSSQTDSKVTQHKNQVRQCPGSASRG